MKVLQVALGQQFDIRDAFAEVSDVVYWDWSGRNRTFNSDLRVLVENHKPDLVFLQIQTPGIIGVDTARYIASKCKVVNWTGDVRHPLPQWFIDIGKVIHMTLFTNMNDVETATARGIRADYLQIGFPEKIFKPEGEVREEAEIVFMGNNHGGFPLSGLRYQMVDSLQRKYGKRFKVFGGNWKGFHAENNQEEEAKIYRGAKIAINLSHFNYSRYSSDRLFRLMGTGVFCLSHNYKDIALEFEVGKHLDVWNDIPELLSKVDYWLQYDIERKHIGRQGAEHVHTNHLWRNRVKQLMEMI